MTAFYYVYNGHGDVTQILTDGVVTSSYYYDAFGNVIEESGTDDNPYRYSGYYYDKESKLYYLNARFYDPETARFLQRDTYRGNPANALSLNLYSYCFNNPIKYYDPTGHVVSNADKANLTKEQQNAIAQCTAAWNAADKAGNEAGKAAAHAAAEAIRNSAGYSGGSDGSGYISTPKTTSPKPSGSSEPSSSGSKKNSSGKSKDVALRSSIENMGGNVEWDAKTSTTTVYLNGQKATFKEGEKGVYIDSDGKMQVDADLLDSRLGTNFATDKDSDKIIPEQSSTEADTTSVLAQYIQDQLLGMMEEYNNSNSKGPMDFGTIFAESVDDLAPYLYAAVAVLASFIADGDSITSLLMKEIGSVPYVEYIPEIRSDGLILDPRADLVVMLNTEIGLILSYVDSVIANPNNMKTKDHTVYVFADGSQRVSYVGRTNDFARRYGEHEEYLIANNLKMRPVITGLDYHSARVMEQILISSYTVEAISNLTNKRREIARGKIPETIPEAAERVANLNWSLYDNDIRAIMDLGR